MAPDNQEVDNGALTDYDVATDKVTYSGDADRNVQLIRPVAVTGAEDSKTVLAMHADNGDGTASMLTMQGDINGAFLEFDASGAVVAMSVSGTVDHDAVDEGRPVKIGGYAKAAAPADVSADGDRVNAWYLRNGAQATVVTAAGALIGGDATNGLDVDVTRLPALVAGTANIGDVDVLTVPAPLSTTGGGTEATALRVTIASDSTGVLSVDDNGGSLTVDGTITASNTAGDVAHGTGDSGNPVKIGLKAANAFPTAEANNDRVNAIGDLFGRQMTTHIDPAQQVHKSFNATTTQTGADVWTPASGKKIAVTSVVIGTYGTTAGRVILWFGDNADTTYTAGTDQLLLAFSTAPSTTSKPGLVFTPAVPVFCTTADRELHITTDANVSIDVACEGYEW